MERRQTGSRTSNKRAAGAPSRSVQHGNSMNKRGQVAQSLPQQRLTRSLRQASAARKGEFLTATLNLNTDPFQIPPALKSGQVQETRYTIPTLNTDFHLQIALANRAKDLQEELVHEISLKVPKSPTSNRIHHNEIVEVD
jgi:hypothetical protein